MTTPNPEQSRIHLVDGLEDILKLLGSYSSQLLPGGTLIVPHNLTRDGLRRAAGRTAPQVLTGWRMLTPLEAATEALRANGIPAQACPGQIGAAAVEAVLAVDLARWPNPSKPPDWMRDAGSLQSKLE